MMDVTKAAIWLRAEDKKFSKDIRFSKFKTPWELDSIRLKWRDKKELIPAEVFGREIMLTGDTTLKTEKVPVIDIGDMLILQFIPQKDLEFVFKVYETFGRLVVTNLSDRNLEALVKYCNSVDERILIAINRLAKLGFKDCCVLLWKELGGLSRDDRLGARVGYYANLLERYRKDKEGYRPDMVRMKLLG